MTQCTPAGIRSGRNRATRSSLFSSPRPRRSYRLCSLETLESRELLANNVLATVELPFSDANTTRDIDMTVTIPNAPVGTRATLMVEISAAAGSTFDPAGVTAFDLAGNRFPVLSNMEDYRGTNSSVSIISVPAGVTRMKVDGEGTSTGRFVAKISLVGDLVSDAGVVSEFEGLYATAALLQAQGRGNFVTKTYYASRGIDMSKNLYDAGLDSDGDGVVDILGSESAQRNVSTRNVTISLAATDATPPVITNLKLNVDDGASTTDKITSDPTISGTITDVLSDVTVFKAKLDKGAFQDFVASIDAKTGGFTFDKATLNTLAGGTLAEGAHTLELMAADEFGNAITPNQTFEFVFINPNADPTEANLPAFAGAKEDTLFKFGAARFFDAGDPGDKLTFQLVPTGKTPVPSWLSINSDGSLQGTPTQAEVGVNHLVTIRATDAFSKSVEGTLTVTVENTNDAPFFNTIGNKSADEGKSSTVDVGSFAKDLDPGDEANLQISVLRVDGFDNAGNPINGQPLPSFMTFNTTTKILTINAGNDDAGKYLIGAIVTDPAGANGNTTFNVTVNENSAPNVQDIPNQTATIGREFQLNVSTLISDPNGDPLTVTAMLADGNALPTWLTFNATTRVFSGTPAAGDVTPITVRVRAVETNNASNSDSDDFTITIVANAPPVVDGIADTTVKVGNNLNFSVANKISDPNDAAATLTVTAQLASGGVLPAWLTFNATTRTFTGTPATGDIGTITIRVTATDPGNASDTDDFTLTVTANQSPVVNAIPDQNATVGTPFSLMVSNRFSDPDSDPLTVTVTRVGSPTTLPAWLTFNATTGVLSGTPTAGDVGTLNLRATASDGTASVSDDFTITVTATATNSVAFTFQFFDTNGNQITTIDPGGTFELRTFVQDVRSTPTGLFSAFLDVTYNGSLATPTGNLTHSTTYGAGTSGSTSTAGLIDEVGGNDGVTPLGGGVFEVFRQRFTAGNTAGTVTFAGNPADDTVLHPVLLFGGSANVPANLIQFVSSTIAIGGLSAPLSSGGSPRTNFTNIYDVNGDTIVSPLDALLIINEMQVPNSAPGAFVDVNSDGVTSPLDALLVINEINRNNLRAPLSSTAGGNDDSDESDASDESGSVFDQIFANADELLYS